MKTLIFMTAYNEEKTVGDVLDGLLDVTSDIPAETEILVVDDNSTDKTLERARERDVRTVSHPVNLGPGAATRTGYKYALRNGFEVVVRMDADGQHRPADLPKLLDPIYGDEADIAILSRYKRDVEYETSLLREVGIRFYSTLVSIVTNETIHDITSGYRAVHIEMGREHAEKLPSGIIAIDRGIREGLSDMRIVEVPAPMEQREHGSSYLAGYRMFVYPFYAMYSMVRTLVRGK